MQGGTNKSMDFNMDIKNLFNKKKEVYPTKKYMNLYHKEDKTTLPATIALYVLFAFVVILAMGKILVYDYIAQLNELKENSLYAQEQIAQKQQQLTDYDKVYNDYIRYSSTETEENQIDRMIILNLIDSSIRPYATVTSVTIEDYTVLVQFSSANLSKIAEITTAIENSPIVQKTIVDTAISTEDNNNIVEASIFIELVQEDKAQ